MKTTLYLVTGDESAPDGERAFATLVEAKKHARDIRDGGDLTSVRRVRTPDLPIRELLAAVFNHEGFVAEAETLAELEPKQEN